MSAIRNLRLAPVAYSEVARGFQRARVVGGALLVIGGIITTLVDVNLASTDVVLAGGVVMAHAITRLRDPSATAFGAVAMDASLAGFLILFAGQPDITSAAALVYLIAASALLLAPVQAVAVGLYITVLTVLVVLWAPLAEGAVEIGASITFNMATAIALFTGTTLLLMTVAFSLLGSRSRHESALETEREAVRLKNEFVSMVSHELRTPLTSIAGFTETLSDGWQSLAPGEVDEFLSIIGGEVRSLSHLVEDILVIPRIEAGRLPLEMTAFELRPMCHAITDILGADTTKDLEVSMPAGIMVEADFMRLQQVIRNLVVNAIKYGGEQILIQGISQGEYLQAVVSDNGPGIQEEDRDRIFERFEQGTSGDARTSTGIGLGLPIARKLMRAMGGDLWFEPRFPTGANFFFSVRMSTQPAPSSLVERQ